MRYHLSVMVLVLFFFPTFLFAETSVSGRVVFEGVSPTPITYETKSNRAVCGDVKEVRPLILGDRGGVANAVVSIVGVQRQSAPAPLEGLLDQVKCEFVPHVQILPVGSTLSITSSDPILHNTHGVYEDGTTAFNVPVPVTCMKVPKRITKPGVVKIRCDAGHTWMNAYVVGVDHPDYALTDENGYFKIDRVPPGTYKIEIWHEWLGIHREPITVGEAREPVSIVLKKEVGN